MTSGASGCSPGYSDEPGAQSAFLASLVPGSGKMASRLGFAQGREGRGESRTWPMARLLDERLMGWAGRSARGGRWHPRTARSVRYLIRRLFYGSRICAGW